MALVGSCCLFRCRRPVGQDNARIRKAAQRLGIHRSLCIQNHRQPVAVGLQHRQNRMLFAVCKANRIARNNVFLCVFRSREANGRVRSVVALVPFLIVRKRRLRSALSVQALQLDQPRARRIGNALPHRLDSRGHQCLTVGLKVLEGVVVTVHGVEAVVPRKTCCENQAQPQLAKGR